MTIEDQHVQISGVEGIARSIPGTEIKGKISTFPTKNGVTRGLSEL